MIYFVAPHPDSFISGGNRMNQQIVQGLEELGAQVIFIGLEQFNVIQSKPLDQFFIDSIYLHPIDSDQLNVMESKKIFVLHLLPSMIDPMSDLEQERMILNSFDLIIVNSQFSKDYLTRYIGWNKSILIVQPFIESQCMNTHIKKNRQVILISNWLPNKQIYEFLIALLSHIPEQVKSLEIHIYGDTTMNKDYFQKCQALISASTWLSHSMHIHGTKDHKSMIEIMKQSCLMIDPSSFETYGMAVAEAIVLGLPVISLGAGHVKYLIGQGKSRSCTSMQELVQKMLEFVQGKFEITPNPIKSIIYQWPDFLNQLKPLVP